jgi:hypothetical protein
MDVDFHISEVDVEYLAEGSGQQVALGSLFSTAAVKTPRKRVRTALEAASKFIMTVRGPFTIIEV